MVTARGLLDLKALAQDPGVDPGVDDESAAPAMTPWLGVVVSVGLFLGRDCGPAGPSSTMTVANACFCACSASAAFPDDVPPSSCTPGGSTTSHSRCAVGRRHAETAQSSGFSTYSDERRSSSSNPASISRVHASISAREHTFVRTRRSAYVSATRGCASIAAARKGSVMLGSSCSLCPSRR